MECSAEPQMTHPFSGTASPVSAFGQSTRRCPFSPQMKQKVLL